MCSSKNQKMFIPPHHPTEGNGNSEGSGGGGGQTHVLAPKLAKPILQQTNKGFRVGMNVYSFVSR